MMKIIASMRFLLFSLLCASPVFSIAQQKADLVMVNWDKQPTLRLKHDKYKNESVVIIADDRKIEYIDINDKLERFRTVHKIIHINDEKGIESYNKIYLDVSDNADIRDIRARTILPNGQIIEVDKKNIKDIQEKERWYKIFAMEGVEKGCEIEFYYTYKVGDSYFGKEILQGPSPVIKSTVQIIAPDRLVFEAKLFNGDYKPVDTVFSGKRFISVSQEDITASEDEKYSAYDAMVKRVEYKLSYNNSRNENVRLFTWSELAKLIHAAYTTVTESEIKKTAELVKRQGWEKLASDSDKIIQVESYLKTNISNRVDFSGDDADNLEKIIKNRQSSNKGIIKLYSAVFTRLGIKHEFVTCGSRYDYEIDKTFENWDNAENSMIYFPSLQKFICPTLGEIRFPWVHPSWSGTNALFSKTTVIGNYTSALGVIKTIPVEDYTKTQSNIDVDIRFAETLDTLVITAINSYVGYSSLYMRYNYNLSSNEDRESMLKDMVKSGTQSENIVSSGFKNVSFDDTRKNLPFIVEAKVKSVELIERAGKKLLVRVGELIGSQAEIYESRPRQFPIYIHYPHLMKRRILLEVPAGYKVLNLNDLNIKSVFEDNGKRTMGFESSYTVDKNLVTIDIIEDYREVHYPLDQYLPFQKIINAAADFNKVVLVLEKK